MFIRICPNISPSNGQLQADLKAGLSQEDFKRALTQALISPLPTAPPVSTGNADSYSRSPQSSLNHTPEQPPNIGTSSELQNVFDERRRRLEADKEQKDAAEIAERKTKAKAKRIELETAEPDSARAKQATYAQLQKKRQQEARHERERILKVIQNDKLERRQKDELCKALNRVQENVSDGAEGLVNKQLFNEVNQSSSKDIRQCAVQVRLFDGSTIRARFSPAQTLRLDVRSWVDHERTDGDSPYTFRQILAPKPNRSISISEEEESLETLGLMPNATLVMVPVQDYTIAYTNGNGLVSRGFNAGYELVSGSVGLVTRALGTFLGLGQRAQPVAQGERGHRATVDPSRVNLNGSAQAIDIRTLRDQQVNRERQQFYNGNQVSH